MIKSIIKDYNEAVFDTDRKKALEIIHNALKAGISPEDVLFKVVIPSLDTSVASISCPGGHNLAQHFTNSQIADSIVKEIITKIEVKPGVYGTVVIGTSSGDLHELGKQIVTGYLKAYLLNVVDLGLCVPPERFVDEAVKNKAQVIAISSMMVHTARGNDGCIKVREILKQKRLEDKIKILVGGAPYNYDSELYKLVGADAWSPDGITAVRIIKDFIKEVSYGNGNEQAHCRC